MAQLIYKIFYNVQELPLDWDENSDNIFLSQRYLLAQEESSPTNMDYIYIGLYGDNNLVGKTIVQRIKLQGAELFRRQNSIKDDLINLLNLNMLCVGNVKLTGEHAYEIKNSTNEINAIKQIQLALKEIRIKSKGEGLPIQLILFKDFYEDSSTRLAQAFDGYACLSVQPNMVFEVDESWHYFEDYLLALRTKYRTRAKRAFRLGDEIVYKEFDLNQIISNNRRLYALYQNVLENNGFSLYQLPSNYFSVMKQTLKDDFKLVAGCLGNEIVCFYTLIINNANVEAGFLGFDNAIQQKYQLYLNMLYQMIAYAIDNNFERIDFSRTALEIKSSVGARPYEMYGFLKHTQPIMNKILSKTFRKFYQPEAWEQRNPFKN